MDRRAEHLVSALGWPAPRPKRPDAAVEIITSPGARSDFFSPNLRSVTETGVDAVMKVFFAAHSDGTPAPQAEPKPSRRVDDDEDEADDVVCEEALLEAFGR